MLAALVDYVLVSHFSHVLALAYTLWALGVLPGSKDSRAQDAPKVLLLVIATLAALVFVDGGISESLYYDSDVPERWLFHLKAFLAAVMVFYPHLSSEFLRIRSPRHLAHDCFPLIIFGAFLALSWIGLPWLYDNFPELPHFDVDPAWTEVWDILLKVPFQTIPLIYALRFVYLDSQQRERPPINNTPPPRYGALPDYFHLPRRTRGNAADTEDDTMHYLVAYFSLLPILWQFNAPWSMMNSFERTITVLSTNILIMTVMAYYQQLVRMAARPVSAV